MLGVIRFNAVLLLLANLSECVNVVKKSFLMADEKKPIKPYRSKAELYRTIFGGIAMTVNLSVAIKIFFFS